MDIWSSLISPFRGYKNLTVRLGLFTGPWEDFPLPTALSIIRFGRALSLGPVQHVRIQEFHELDVIEPFARITQLIVAISDEQGMFWHILRKHSAWLESLSLVDSMSPAPAGDLALLLPVLTSLEVGIYTVDFGRRLLEDRCLPNLLSLTVRADYRAGQNTYMDSLRELVALGLLPPRSCHHRQYKLELRTSLEELERCLGILSSILSDRLHLDVEIQGTGGLLDAPFDAQALAKATQLPPRGGIRSIKLYISGGNVARPDGNASLPFENLNKTENTIYESATKWSTHVLHQILPGFAAPKLRTALLFDFSSPTLARCHVRLLHNCITLWSYLQCLQFAGHVEDAGADLLEEAADLHASCNAANVHCSILPLEELGTWADLSL